jgi:hypothetical protein
MHRPARRTVLVTRLSAARAACSTGGAGDETCRPLVGQGGKDVMWVPTLDGRVLPMLELAAVTADDSSTTSARGTARSRSGPPAGSVRVPPASSTTR